MMARFLAELKQERQNVAQFAAKQLCTTAPLSSEKSSVLAYCSSTHGTNGNRSALFCKGRVSVAGTSDYEAFDKNDQKPALALLQHWYCNRQQRGRFQA